MFLRTALLATLAILAPPAFALEMVYAPEFRSGNIRDDANIYLEGPVEFGDEIKLARMLAQHPDVKEIIVGQSPGGSLHAGIVIADLIYRRELHVKLEGPAGSAATIISLGSKTRIRFQGDFAHQQGTTLQFHCAYKRGNSYCDEPATRASAKRLASYTSWSTDRWMMLLMSTSPSTYKRVSLWDVIDKSQWNCEAEAHLSVVCHSKTAKTSTPQSASKPVTNPATVGPDIRMICNREGKITNIRKGPSAKNFPKLESVRNGQKITVLREVVNPDGYLYYEIEFGLPHYQDTVIGYVYHEAVAKNCN